MQFNRLEINNFMSYHNEGIDLDDFKNLTLIEGVNEDEGGSNGSGKSTMWDAISWCLFGTTVRGLKNDDVINRKYGKECLVSLNITHGTKTYIIHRYRKHSTMLNRLIIHDIDADKDIELGTLAMTQDWMEKEFDLDFDLFRCTVIFAQGETFNFVNAGNKKQKEILSKVMKIDFDVLLKKTRSQKKELEMDLDTMERKILTLKSHVKERPEEEFEDDMKAWKANNSRMRQNLDLDNDSIVHDIEVLQKIKKAPLDKILEKLGDKIGAFKSVENKIRDKISEHKAEFRFGNIALDKLDKAIDSGECENCGQETTGERMKIRRHSLGNKLMAPQIAMSTLEDKLVKIEFKTDELEEKLGQVKELKFKQKMDEGKLEELKRKKEDNARRIKELDAEKNPFQDLLDREIEKQRDIQKKLVELGSKVERNADQLIHISFWVEAFGDGGIKSFIFDLIASTLSEKSNKYVNILTSGQVSVKFDTQSTLKSGAVREKFDCAVISDGKKVKYDAYSGGEKRKISLAVDVALSEIASEYHGSSFNVVVFDEQTNYLDENGRDGFYDLLKELARDRKVFVVDHDSKFRSKFDNVMTVVKRGGVSIIE